MKRSEKKKAKCPLHIIITMLLVAVLIFLVIYNSFKFDRFLEASLSSCLSIACVIGVSYFLVQNQTDKRRKKEILLRLLTSIQDLVTDRDAYIISATTTKESMTMRNRRINNHLQILKEHSNEFGIQEEVLYVQEKFKEYEELIGDHIEDMNYLMNSQKELQRPLDLINTKLFEIMFCVY